VADKNVARQQDLHSYLQAAGIGGVLGALGNDHQGNVCTATIICMRNLEDSEPVTMREIRDPDFFDIHQAVATRQRLRGYIVTDTVPNSIAISSS